MNQIELHIDEIRSKFILRGEINSLVKNRRVNFYLFNSLSAKQENNEILIPYEQGNRSLLLRDIHDALSKYGIKQNDSSEIKEALDSYYTEKENFKSFSSKAKGIWNNNIDVEEFSNFRKSLEQNLTNRTLYDKQLLAAFHLAFSQNACNFSVPGAGKTSVVYGAYTYLKNLPFDHPKHVNKLMIIGPLSSFGPWENEYNECFGVPVYSKRLSGGVTKEDRDRHLLSVTDFDKTPELTLMSYQSVSFNMENLTHFLSRKGHKTMIVLDEAHKIKNVSGGVWATAVLNLAKLPSVKSRVILTGTPIPNGYEDIYNLYDFIWPDKDIIDFNIYQLQEMSNNSYDPRIDQLIESISPFFIRIRKKDILPSEIFPINNYDPVIVEMGKVQREIYDFLERNYINYFERTYGDYSITAKLINARFIRLMQVATNPNLLKKSLEKYFLESGLSSDLYIDDSEIITKILQYRELESVPAKFEAIKKLVEQILNKGEKVIIWGTFIQNIKELQEYLQEFGIKSEKLIGEVPVETDEIADDIVTREKIIKEFHNPNSSFKVILANPFAVAESISLHKACNNAIYFERTFNAANFIQSKDRIHRVGLKKGTPTNYYYIISKDSIDETIHNRLIEKESRMLELIESHDIPLLSENLNYDVDLNNDIKAIIRDYVKRTAKA